MSYEKRGCGMTENEFTVSSNLSAEETFNLIEGLFKRNAELEAEIKELKELLVEQNRQYLQLKRQKEKEYFELSMRQRRGNYD